MSVVEFYGLEAQKLLADGKKIALFTKHPGTLGAYREARLREYLSEHVPSRFAVTSGFVTDHDPARANPYDRSSLQVDCLIHDASEFAPLLRTEEFAIVTPKPVAAIVEVKSALTLSRRSLKKSESGGFTTAKGRRYKWQGTLVDALENLKSAIDVMEAAKICRGTYFAGIIAYSANSLPKLVKAMTSGELFQQLEIGELDQLPDCICILDGPAWTFALSGEAEPEIYGLGEIASSYSFAVKFPHADAGSALQLFTAFLDHAVSVERLEQGHTIGGMRSAAGYGAKTVSHRVEVPSPRQHDLKCCRTVLDNGVSVTTCERRQK